MSAEQGVDHAEAVLAAAGRWAAAFNRGDAEGCAGAYTEQARMRAEPLAEVVGRAAIEDFWRDLIAAGFSNIRYLDPRVEMVAENRARLTSPWAMNRARGIIHAEDWILEDDGVWRLVADHFEILDRFDAATPTRFLLVHGAWMGAWSWEPVARILEASGLDVSCVDLPGHGRRRREPAPALAAYVDAVATTLASVGEPVILVGHSFGGVTISQLAERSPERVRALVYVSAFLLPDGASFLSATAGVAGSEVLENLVFVDDGRAVDVRLDALHRAVAADVPADAFEAVLTKMVSEPMAPLGDALAIGRERWGRVPRYYIETTEDLAVPVGVQRAMYRSIPVVEVFSLRASHCPMLSKPQELASVLRAIHADTTLG